jgi:nucleoside-diphosphate-sugar epimerase
MTKKILVTGMSGLIGGLAGRDLATDYDVRALNRRAIEGVDCLQADIADMAAIRPAFDGIDTVVHMAAYLGAELEGHLQANIRGVYNVFEAARQAGVRRVIFGSSGATVNHHEKEEPYVAMTEARWADVPEDVPLIDHTSALRPTGMYGAAKAWGEALGRVYSEEHGLSVICIRLGRVTEEDWPRDARHAAVYLSHRDVTQMIRKCVEAPDEIAYEIVYAVSDNRGRFRDIEHAHKTVGYIPQDGVQDWPSAKPN